MKILLIEDDYQLSKAIEKFLKIKQYEVETVDDGEIAIDCIDSSIYDLYIVDINLPNVSGLDIIKYIRQKDKNSSIIIITASMEVDNFLEAYKNGCDEYLKKPFHLKELEVIINKHITSANEDIITINESTSYNPKFEELSVDGKIVNLRKKEKRLLSILIKNKSHVVQNEDIINYVWENDIKEKYPLRQLVNELRNKFPHAKEYIQTNVGIGYKIEF